MDLKSLLMLFYLSLCILLLEADTVPGFDVVNSSESVGRGVIVTVMCFIVFQGVSCQVV